MQRVDRVSVPARAELNDSSWVASAAKLGSYNGEICSGVSQAAGAAYLSGDIDEAHRRAQMAVEAEILGIMSKFEKMRMRDLQQRVCGQISPQVPFYRQEHGLGRHGVTMGATPSDGYMISQPLSWPPPLYRCR